MAISPVGSSRSSTQLPLGLLRALLSHVLSVACISCMTAPSSYYFDHGERPPWVCPVPTAIFLLQEPMHVHQPLHLHALRGKIADTHPPHNRTAQDNS